MYDDVFIYGEYDLKCWWENFNEKFCDVVCLVYAWHIGGHKRGIMYSNNYLDSNIIEWVIWWEAQEVLTNGLLVISIKRTNFVDGKVMTPLFDFIEHKYYYKCIHILKSYIKDAYSDNRF